MLSFNQTVIRTTLKESEVLLVLSKLQLLPDTLLKLIYRRSWIHFHVNETPVIKINANGHKTFVLLINFDVDRHQDRRDLCVRWTLVSSLQNHRVSKQSRAYNR